MGITGLLPLLRPITKTVHIGKYEDQTIVIDGYSWIHKGIYGSSLDLLEGKPNRKYIDYCLTRAKFLIEHKIKPVFVFDGGHLPMKAIEEQERRQRRENNRKMALKALKKGDRSMAWQNANKCANVTPEMAHRLMLELTQNNIEFVVAPYEADPQMAYLCRIGAADAVLTEDSDLLLFECPKVLYKFNIADGYVEEIQIVQNLHKVKKEMNFENFTLPMLRHMCILSGCDYLPSIPKMGLKTAHRYISTYGNYEKALNAIRSSGQFCVPENYEKQFYEAELTFLFQRVYCPKSKSMVHLSEDIEGKLLAFQDLSFLGPFLDDSIVQGIASGKLCPNTYEPFDEESLLVTSPFVSLVKPTILQGTSGALKMPANGASKTIAKVISEIPQGRTTVKSQIEFWKRVTLKRTHKQLEAVLTPAKKAKEIIEGIMDSTLEPIESPYFSKKAVQDNSCELTHTVDDHEVIRRSPRIHRTYPSTKLASPQPPSKSQELFFAKENTRNNNITKEKTITNVRSMTTKKFVSSSANSPGARTLIDGNVKHFLDSFAANPIVLTGSLYSKNESRPTRATGRK